MKEQPKLAVKIREAYEVYKPSFPVAKTVRKMLLGIPQKYLNGIGTVVVRDYESYNRKRKRQKYRGKKEKLKLNECRGFYHAACGGEPAWIELIIDKIIPDGQRMVWKIPFIREMRISQALYHEIGHHLHETVAPEYKEKENVADEWERKLSYYYFYHRYGYILVPLSWLARPFKKTIKKILKERKNKH